MLKAGEKLELELLPHLQKYFPKAYKIEGNYKFADLVVPELDNLLIEVKQDLKSDHTGNLAIEYQFRGQNSGLASTKALVWIMADKEKFYAFSVEKLKSFLRANWEYLKKVEGGDDMDSKMVLVKKKDLANRSICCSFNRNGEQDSLLATFLNMI